MKKIVMSILLFSVLLPSLVLAAQSPLTKEEIKAAFVANMDRVTTRSPVTVEVTDTGSYYKEVRNSVEYLGYAHLVYIYWEGSYGQKTRESVEIDFLQMGGRWIYDNIMKYADATVLVQGPTKPLPSVPEKPAVDSVTKLIEEALPRANDLMERFVDKNQVYTINKLNVGDPVFEWRGLDYEYAAFVYSGTMEYTLADIRDKKHKYDQIWTCNCEVTMLYSVAKQKWECAVNTTNASQIK